MLLHGQLGKQLQPAHMLVVQVHRGQLVLACVTGCHLQVAQSLHTCHTTLWLAQALDAVMWRCWLGISAMCVRFLPVLHASSQMRGQLVLSIGHCMLASFELHYCNLQSWHAFEVAVAMNCMTYAWAAPQPA